MEFEDESKPKIHKAKIFNQPSNMQIKDEDSDSEETLSLQSTKPKMDFSQYANPSKLETYEEDESDEEDDDLTTEGDFSEEDSDGETRTVASNSFNNQFTQKMSRDPQEGIKKRKILIELMSMKRTHGIELSHGISERSSLAELSLERDMHKKYLEIEETKALYRGWIVHFANGAELISGIVPKNKYLNPKLKGWSGHIHQNIEEFDSCLRDLAEKYGSGSSPPELRLIYLLFTSAAMYHVTQKGKEMLGNDTMNNLNKAMSNMQGGNSGGGGNMQGPDLGSVMGNFNPFEMLNAFRPSAPPNQAQSAPPPPQQTRSQVPQMNQSQIQQNSIPNFGHVAPSKPTGPLINPGKPMDLSGIDVTRPMNTSPDIVAQRLAPPSPGRFSVESSDSEPEIKYRPTTKRKKKTGSIKRGFKLG